MKINHSLIDISDIDLAQWNKLYYLACDIEENPQKYAQACRGKIMASMFFEPSTRTQSSFQAAMLRLGGSVIGFSGTGGTSVQKGENFQDTVYIMSQYSDLITIRHPQDGAALAASEICDIPVINAGDGRHLHPTQSLTDLMTITRLKGNIENLNIAICGDLLYGRAVHTLLFALSKFKHNKIYLISTAKLRVPQYVKDIVIQSGNTLIECESLEEYMSEFDVLYMTRIQRERFDSQEEYLAQSGIYVLTAEKLKKAKSDMIILHPLPKVDEIEYAVDSDPRAKYFAQAKYGMYIRMALILSMLNGDFISHFPKPQSGKACNNPHCISCNEKHLPALSKFKASKEFCVYCDCEK